MKGLDMGKKQKFEIIRVESTDFTVDISDLIAKDELWFNATEIAKAYGKQPSDYLRLDNTKKYIDAVSFKYGISPNKIVDVRQGKYGGTWLHKLMRWDFGRWISPKFAVLLDAELDRLFEDASKWRAERLEAKTGYLGLSEAVMKAHNPAAFYHYSTEADMLNRIVFGISAKQYRKENNCENCKPRDSGSAKELRILKILQQINAGLIDADIDYQDRKDDLEKMFDKLNS
jgi:hypothetical protein